MAGNTRSSQKKKLPMLTCPNPNCTAIKATGKPYKWTPKKKNPVQCPCCKQYFVRFLKPGQKIGDKR